MDAKEAAVSYLNIKPRTRMQVVKYLEKKGFDEDKIREAVEEMEEYHYIDDFEYSTMYFQYGFDKGRGISRIKRELAQKGVEKSVIEDAFEHLEEVPDQYEAAKEIALSMVADMDMNDLSYEDRKKLQAKIGRRLVSRGFTSEIVYAVINDID